MAKCGKVTHRGYDSAVSHIVALIRDGKARGHRMLHVYVCRDCGGYHVGHRPKGLLAAQAGAGKVTPVIQAERDRCECACRKAATQTLRTPTGTIRVCEHHAARLFRVERR